jgi:hypothetical protein
MLGLKSESDARYQWFLKKVSETKKVYVFTQGDEFGCCPSHEFVIENDLIIPLEDAIEETEEFIDCAFLVKRSLSKGMVKS